MASHSGDVPLSDRETQVVSLIAGGMTNPEIAAELFVTVNTVKTYIRSAYRKIGVKRRAQAVAWAVQNGLLHEGGAREHAPASGGQRSDHRPRVSVSARP